MVLLSGSTVLYSFGGVFWSGHKPGHSSLGPNSIKRTTESLPLPQLHFCKWLQVRGQDSDVVSPPFLLSYFSTIDWLRKWGNIADIKTAFSVRIDFKTKWFPWLLPFCPYLGIIVKRETFG